MSTYYIENKERILENSRIYNAINYDKIRAYQREYYHRKKKQQKNNNEKNKNHDIKNKVELPKKRYYKMNEWKDNKHLLPTAEIKVIDNGKKVFIINFD
jgi:hypothetical protein